MEVGAYFKTSLVGRLRSKLKAALKDFGARTRDALDQAIQRAMDLVGADDAQAWFRHCGYEAPGK